MQVGLIVAFSAAAKGGPLVAARSAPRIRPSSAGLLAGGAVATRGPSRPGSAAGRAAPHPHGAYRPGAEPRGEPSRPGTPGLDALEGTLGQMRKIAYTRHKEL